MFILPDFGDVYRPFEAQLMTNPGPRKHLRNPESVDKSQGSFRQIAIGCGKGVDADRRRHDGKAPDREFGVITGRYHCPFLPLPIPSAND